MKKENLRNGDICILRNKQVYVYIKDEINDLYDLLYIEGGYMPTKDYNSDLTIKNNDKEWDIVKIYRPKYIQKLFKLIRQKDIDFENCDLKLIFEREKEVKKMTVAQICKELGYDVEIIKEDN